MIEGKSNFFFLNKTKINVLNKGKYFTKSFFSKK